MELQVLDTVVLTRDLSEHGLRTGDLGTVVELYAPDGLEVEFVLASGKTKALVARRRPPSIRVCPARRRPGSRRRPRASIT